MMFKMADPLMFMQPSYYRTPNYVPAPDPLLCLSVCPFLEESRKIPPTDKLLEEERAKEAIRERRRKQKEAREVRKRKQSEGRIARPWRSQNL